MTIEDFVPPFGGKLDAGNRWVTMASIMPWDMIEDIYSRTFKGENMDGRPPIPSRIAFGALYIKEYENLTQERALQHISENVYMQYFLGLTEFIPAPLFNSSMMTHFASRFGKDDLAEINEEIYRRTRPPEDPPADCGGDGKASGAGEGIGDASDAYDAEADGVGGECETSGAGEGIGDVSDASGAEAEGVGGVCGDGEISEGKEDCGGNCETRGASADGGSGSSSSSSSSSGVSEGGGNKGTLILDATVAPADIRYPNDLSLLNECRESTEKIIDEIWDKTERKGHKTAYSRKKARKGYMKIAKQRKPRKKQIRQAVREQLECVEKNLEGLEEMLDKAGVEEYLKHCGKFETIKKIADQQRLHYDKPGEPIPDRIVSLRQPHVRPIVRGKARGEVEFGQKLSLSIVDGFTFIESQSWDNFAEGKTLIASVEKYRERHGAYPAAVLADKTYRNRENIAYCKERGIRLSGPRLGRPKASEVEADKEQAYRDGCDRNIVEGRIGTNKRRYGLGLVYARLENTGETEAALNVLCMNVANETRPPRRRPSVAANA